MVFNFVPAIIWVFASAWHVFARGQAAFVFMLVSGILYLAISSKVTFYTTKPFYLRKAEGRDPIFVPKSAGID